MISKTKVIKEKWGQYFANNHFCTPLCSTRILASSDFILTSNEVKKMETQVQLLAFFRLLPQCLVEFTTKISV